MAILCTFCVLLVRLKSLLSNTNANSDIVQREPMTSCNISPTPINNYTQLTWHTDTNQNPTAKLPISLSSTLQKTRHFQRTNLNQYFPKMLQSKKLTTKISSQTEFTMSQRLLAHNYHCRISLTKTVRCMDGKIGCVTTGKSCSQPYFTRSFEYCIFLWTWHPERLSYQSVISGHIKTRAPHSDQILCED